ARHLFVDDAARFQESEARGGGNRSVDQGGDCLFPEHVADQSRGLGKRLGLSWQLIESRRDQRAERPRDPRRARPFGDHRRKFLEKEGVSLGPLGERFVDGECRGELPRLAGRKRFHCNSRRPRVRQYTRNALCELGASLEDEDDRSRSDCVNELLQRLDQGPTRPVKIVEHDDSRPARRKPLEKASKSPDQLGAGGNWGARGAYDRTKLSLDQRGLFLRVSETQVHMQLLVGNIRRVGLGDADLLSHDFRQRTPRCCLAIRRTRGSVDQGATKRARRKLVSETALADARLPQDNSYSSLPATNGRLQGGRELLEFALTPDKVQSPAA